MTDRRGWWENPDEHERVDVTAYPEEWFHLHGKALSGLRHSHPLRDGEDRDEPWHDHEGEYTLPPGGDLDRRGVGPALYPVQAWRSATARDLLTNPVEED